MKEQLAAGLSEGQIAELVENDEVHAGEIFGEPPLPAGAGFALQPIDEIDDGIEVQQQQGEGQKVKDRRVLVPLSRAGDASDRVEPREAGAPGSLHRWF